MHAAHKVLSFTRITWAENLVQLGWCPCRIRWFPWDVRLLVLDRLFLFLSMKFNIVEHCFGRKIAVIPSMQIAPKSEPTSGFRQGKFSRTVGGFSASIVVRKSPKSEALVMNIRRGLRSRPWGIESLLSRGS